MIKHAACISLKRSSENTLSDDLSYFKFKYSGLNLNQYGVASPCRTILWGTVSFCTNNK
ncbi:hypothetical protein NEIMUCOT_03943 [Neisseria mucosa ATCC 25996]|uniref:Uncharacterized protein n=1 Tax=Neisseria mucosa (strain ATCC 25996 / DSM 4631 / NCTC 10774 / M26) TaxID=546266 RepID=D2ZTK7_NEIM2|nr:hypothetical protein NEIMUCOT_03943 [Neisseria mucosa ATCC 25996]